LPISGGAETVSPVVVLVAPMRLTMVWKSTSGRPRQLMLMYANSRCSILFHLLVPGGRWHTVIGIWSASDKAWRRTFHSRLRLLLVPPSWAGTSRDPAR